MLKFNTFDARLENELFACHDTAFCHPYEWEITHAAQTTWLSAKISYDPELEEHDLHRQLATKSTASKSLRQPKDYLQSTDP